MDHTGTMDMTAMMEEESSSQNDDDSSNKNCNNNESNDAQSFGVGSSFIGMQGPSISARHPRNSPTTRRSNANISHLGVAPPNLHQQERHDDDHSGSSSSGAKYSVGRHVNQDANISNNTLPDPKATSDMLILELNDMSVAEREKASDDVHGISKSTREENLELALEAMNRELSQIPNKAAYNQASHLDASFVQNSRLGFLRAEEYNPAKAATRIIAYFQAKLELFGPNLLTKPITMTSLDNVINKPLQSGCIQILTKRDSAGRAVLFYAPRFHNLDEEDVTNHPPDTSLVKAFWYMISAAMDDEETQRKGLVLVIYNVGPMNFNATDREAMAKAFPLVSCLPVRFASIHYCFDDPEMEPFMALVMSSIGGKNRARFRIHNGSDTECQQALLSFGIPVATLPLDSESELKSKDHRKWIYRRKIKETAISRGKPFGGIDLPAKQDVLLGRGKPVQQHSGNVELLEVIQSQQSSYATTQRGSKSEIAESVVQKLKEETQARFLQRRQDGWWFEVPHDSAVEKVCYSFRNIRMKSSRKVSGGSKSSSSKTRGDETEANAEHPIEYDGRRKTSATTTGGQEQHAQSFSSTGIFLEQIKSNPFIRPEKMVPTPSDNNSNLDKPSNNLNSNFDDSGEDSFAAVPVSKDDHGGRPQKRHRKRW